MSLVAGLIAAVRLARVESEELSRRSPRVRCAIADSISIARMVIEAAKARHEPESSLQTLVTSIKIAQFKQAAARTL
jgi:hypothetical protein